jgi:hypothetical protein
VWDSVQPDDALLEILTDDLVVNWWVVLMAVAAVVLPDICVMVPESAMITPMDVPSAQAVVPLSCASPAVVVPIHTLSTSAVKAVSSLTKTVPPKTTPIGLVVLVAMPTMFVAGVVARSLAVKGRGGAADYIAKIRNGALEVASAETADPFESRCVRCGEHSATRDVVAGRRR